MANQNDRKPPKVAIYDRYGAWAQFMAAKRNNPEQAESLQQLAEQKQEYGKRAGASKIDILPVSLSEE